MTSTRHQPAGGWVNADWCGGWTCHVEQGRYGHRARKATWLYAVGVEPPALDWGSSAAGDHEALVGWCGNHVKSGETRAGLGKAAATCTPLAFRDVLIAMGRSAMTLTPAPPRA